MKKTFVRALLVAAVTLVTACGQSSSENIPADSRGVGEAADRPVEDEDEGADPQPTAEAQPMSKLSQSAAASSVAQAEAGGATEHAAQMQSASEQGDADAALTAHENAVTASVASSDAAVFAELLLGNAAAAGECDCDSNATVEAYAEDGDSTALALLHGCEIHAEVTNGDETVSATLTRSGLCDDLALSLITTRDVLVLVEDALSTCQEVVDSSLAGAQSALNCDDPASMLGGLPVGEVDLDDALGDLQEACAELEALEGVCEQSADEALSAAEEALEDAAAWVDAFEDDLEDIETLEDVEQAIADAEQAAEDAEQAARDAEQAAEEAAGDAEDAAGDAEDAAGDAEDAAGDTTD